MVKVDQDKNEERDPPAAADPRIPRDPPLPSPCDPAANSLWSLETLGKVTEGVAHDFNNILATISGFAELILHNDERPEGKPKDVNAFARYILQAALTGQSTVRQLRGFTRQGSDERESLDVQELLDQSIAMARGALGRISVSAEHMPGRPSVFGCRGMLHNVFINLLFNARDAMPAGGAITVRTFRLNTGVPTAEGIPGYLVVAVKDTGTGMSEEVLGRIFQPFFTTKGGRGSGMGLANVDATVKAHGGWVTVDSAPGKGSEFRIHLPLEERPQGNL